MISLFDTIWEAVWFTISVSDESLSFPYDKETPFALKEPENPFFSSLCLLYAFVSNGFISTFSPFKLILPLETTFTPSSKRLFLLSYVKPLSPASVADNIAFSA